VFNFGLLIVANIKTVSEIQEEHV